MIPSNVFVTNQNYWVCWQQLDGAAKCSVHCICQAASFEECWWVGEVHFVTINPSFLEIVVSRAQCACQRSRSVTVVSMGAVK